jgi:hypothetical protein
VKVNSNLTFGTPSVTVSNAVIDEGQKTTLTANAIGGTAPYSYIWTFNGNTIGTNSDALTFYGNASTLGSDTVFVEVTDNSGQTAASSGNVKVNSNLTIGAPTFTNTTIDQTQLSMVNATLPITGTPGYTYTWYVSYDNGNEVPANSLICNPNYSQASGYGTAGQKIVCQFLTNTSSLTGNYAFEVKVTDSAPVPDTVYSAANILTLNPELMDPISPMKASLKLGGRINVIENMSGGTRPYNFTWYVSYDNAPAVSAGSACSLLTPNSMPTYSNSTVCTFAPNATAKLGDYKFFVHIVDSASTPMAVNSLMSNITVLNSALNASAMPKNSVLDVGQSEQLNTSVTGGNSPYAYQWFNDTGAIMPGVSMNGMIQGHITFSADSVGKYSYYAYVTDNSLVNKTASNNATVVVNTDPALILYVTPGASINTGTVPTVSTSITGGTGPFVYSWTINGNPVSDSSSAYTFGSAPSAGTYTITVNASDAGTSIPYVFSNTIVITVSVPTLHQNNNGGGGGGSGGGGGGLPYPIITPVGACITASNIAVPATFTVDMGNQSLGSNLNFISPTTAGITIDGISYTLPLGVSVNLTGTEITMRLLNISYIPMQHTVAIEFCPKPQIHTSTTITNTTASNKNSTTSGTGGKNLFSITFNDTPGTGMVSFNGANYINGQKTSGLGAGTYAIHAYAPSGMAFKDWITSSNVILDNALLSSTTATIKGSGFLDAVFVPIIPMTKNTTTVAHNTTITAPPASDNSLILIIVIIAAIVVILLYVSGRYMGKKSFGRK